MELQSYDFLAATLPVVLTVVVDLAFIAVSLAFVWPVHRSAAAFIAAWGFLSLLALCGGLASTMAATRMMEHGADLETLGRNAVIVHLGGAVLHAVAAALLVTGIVQLALALRRERRGPAVAAG